MVRNRTAVLVEWIEYHRIIGVEHFYIYDHFSNDNLDNFLRSYLEQQIVTIVRWPYKQHKGHKWNMMQSAAMNHALKNFGPFNRWMGYFDVDEYFQIINPIKVLDKTISLSDFLDRNFPESIYPGGVQLRNCPISCLINQDDLATSRHRLLLEKCRHISRHRDCQIRTKMFIRPQNVPIMQNIHKLQYGVKFAETSVKTNENILTDICKLCTVCSIKYCDTPKSLCMRLEQKKKFASWKETKCNFNYLTIS
ncbi:MAG: hypothetical protein BGN96_17355 [Bacteroidales bacterium 45-6]|nr:MAG: hypothetical protein BGN96_17355 [Bacteroidales bacterium 45-6]